MAHDPVDIVDCVQGAVELLAPRAFQKQLQLVWSIAPDMPRQFLGDETRLRQILLNLLGNAVKYTETGGISVWVGAEPAADDMDRINVVIRDTGPGLSEEARARIFMEFERGVSDGAQHESGTGLGLAIAQRLAQRMGGGISVTSTPGAGATFTLAVHLPRAGNSAGNEMVGKLRRRHVVMVSKARIERSTIANFLRAHDVAVTEANTIGDLAASATWHAGDPPDTVLLDSDTDPEAAWPVLDRLARQGNIEAAVIVANGNRSELDRFRSAGVENFLVRPIRPSTLLALLAGEIDQPAAPAVIAQADLTKSTPGAHWRVLVAEDNEINALLTPHCHNEARQRGHCRPEWQRGNRGNGTRACRAGAARGRHSDGPAHAGDGRFCCDSEDPSHVRRCRCAPSGDHRGDRQRVRGRSRPVPRRRHG